MGTLSAATSLLFDRSFVSCLKIAANIFISDEMLKKATVNMGEVFGSREKGG